MATSAENGGEAHCHRELHREREGVAISGSLLRPPSPSPPIHCEALSESRPSATEIALSRTRARGTLAAGARSVRTCSGGKSATDLAAGYALLAPFSPTTCLQHLTADFPNLPAAPNWYPNTRLQRLLLEETGSITFLLRTIYQEPIVPQAVRTQEMQCLPHRCSELRLGSGHPVWRRQVVLCGRDTGVPYVYADSLVVLDRLSLQVRHAIREGRIPIGAALQAARYEIFRDIVRRWATCVQTVATYLPQGFRLPLDETPSGKGEGLLVPVRVTYMYTRQRPILAIREAFLCAAASITSPATTTLGAACSP